MYSEVEAVNIKFENFAKTDNYVSTVYYQIINAQSKEIEINNLSAIS